MEILKKNLSNGICRAEQYRLSNKRHAEGLSVHIEYLYDLMKSLLKDFNKGYTKPNDIEKLIADAEWTLENLERDLVHLREQNSIENEPSLVMAQAFHGDKGVPGIILRKPLPNLKIPSFAGDNSIDFRKFVSTFLHAIDREPSLTNKEKLELLKTHLKRKAFDIVNGIPTSDKHYRLTLKILEDLYDNEKHGIVKLNESLEALPRVSTSDKSEFRQTYWKLESIVRSLEEVGFNVNKSFAQVLYQQKFPEEILKLALTEKSDMPLNELREMIGRMVRVQEMCEELNLETGSSENHSSDDEASDKINGRENVPGNSAFSKGSSSQKIADNSHLSWTWCTLCTTVANRKNGAETSVRLLFLSIPPVSLLTESAAIRLGIKLPRHRTLRLKHFHNERFTASAVSFKLLIHVSDGPPEPIEVHIVKDGLDGGDLPAVTVEDFKKENPHLSFLDVPDPGKGRPVDLFLGKTYFDKYFIGQRVDNVKDGWSLISTRFGWMLGGRVQDTCKKTTLIYVYEDDRLP